MTEKISYKISQYLYWEDVVARFESIGDLILALKDEVIVAEGRVNSDQQVGQAEVGEIGLTEQETQIDQHHERIPAHAWHTYTLKDSVLRKDTWTKHGTGGFHLYYDRMLVLEKYRFYWAFELWDVIPPGPPLFLMHK